MAVRTRKRLGDILIEANVITQEQLMQALAKQKEIGKRLGETLIEMKLTDEMEIAEAIGQQMKLKIAKIREAMLEMPAPIVSVVDINKGQKRVKVQNSLGKLGRKKYK